MKEKKKTKCKVVGKSSKTVMSELKSTESAGLSTVLVESKPSKPTKSRITCRQVINVSLEFERLADKRYLPGNLPSLTGPLLSRLYTYRIHNSVSSRSILCTETLCTISKGEYKCIYLMSGLLMQLIIFLVHSTYQYVLVDNCSPLVDRLRGRDTLLTDINPNNHGIIHFPARVS